MVMLKLATLLSYGRGAKLADSHKAIIYKKKMRIKLGSLTRESDSLVLRFGIYISKRPRVASSTRNLV